MADRPADPQTRVGSLAGQGRDEGADGGGQEEVPREFECSICIKILLLPVTTPCGHNFCKGCIEEVRRWERRECFGMQSELSFASSPKSTATRSAFGCAGAGVPADVSSVPGSASPFNFFERRRRRRGGAGFVAIDFVCKHAFATAAGGPLPACHAAAPRRRAANAGGRRGLGGRQLHGDAAVEFERSSRAWPFASAENARPLPPHRPHAPAAPLDFAFAGFAGLLPRRRVGL